ncbi:MAG: hypothetical protein ACTSUX_13645 [Promethearchaeota archaeon]
MRIRIKIKKKLKEKKITIFVQRKTIIEAELLELLNFFNDNITLKKIRLIFPYYKITSHEIPIMLSLISALGELIPDAFLDDPPDIEVRNSPIS